MSNTPLTVDEINHELDVLQDRQRAQREENASISAGIKKMQAALKRLES